MLADKERKMTDFHKNTDPIMTLANRAEKERRKAGYKCLIIRLLLTASMSFLLFTFVIGVAVVEGISMAPTLENRDILLFYRLNRNYEAGNIVVFETGDGGNLIKRIVALEGQIVDIDNSTGTLLVDGQPIEEDYIYTNTYSWKKEVEFPLTVKKGNVFVLGDNRENSTDSRISDIGQIQENKIIGTLWCLIFRCI